MPRQDVPYGGAICRLKERIAEIWDKLGEKLHSINGVEGDGAGDVKIVSGDAAVVINNDQIGNKIEVGLDKSKLPSAAVSSVNGETGAVVLDAGDIPTRGNANVQTDIDAVAQLAADVPNKVDKITSGSTKRAYTHTGSVQDDTPAVDGPDANSIGLRDANGRMQAADPAAGATDKTLVTANWVSQTGNSAPNNVAHRYGKETLYGIKTFSDLSIFQNTIQSKTDYARTDAAGKKKYILSIFDTEGIIFGGITISTDNNGKTHLGVYVYDADGTWHGGNII